ncbi:DUF5686 family protein [Flavobacterium sp.]
MKNIFLFLLFCCLPLQAQQQITGIVKDFNTNKPLPFATITINSEQTLTTDGDGKFEILKLKKPHTITVHYIGYSSKKILISSHKFQTVFLEPKVDTLKTIIITNQNLANSIITKVIAKREKNDPQKILNYFQFKAYNKLLVSANPDSVKGKIDSIFVEREFGKELSKIDSTEFKFKKIIDKQHLFLAEKISTFQFAKPVLKETILASKMAGFKEPIYELFGFNLQSFSIYDDTYELFETNYKSPISENATREYQYSVTDTISIDNRETFVIYFKNSKKKKGLEGLLFIDSQNFSVAKAVMQIKGIINITAVHEFNFLSDYQIWFPTKKDFKITKGKSKEKTSFLGGRIVFDADDDEEKREKKSADFTYFSSETRITDVTINVPIVLKKSFIKVQVNEFNEAKSENYWQENRTFALQERGLQTYKILDSIANDRNLDTKIRFGRKIFNGYVPLSIFDFDLRHLISYNNYEGFRFGLGGTTNEKFSKVYKIDGYSAYGLKDETIKYSIGSAARIGKFSNTWVGLSYTDDLREIASTSFAIDKRVFKLYDPRPINISTFYNYKMWRAYIETKIFPKTESIWQFTYNDITPLFDYTFVHNGTNYNRFKMTTAIVSLQWNPFSDFMQTPNGKIEIEKRFPKFTFQFTKSIPNLFDNDFDFGKFDLRIDYEKKYLNGQKSAFLMQSGYTIGAIPITHLYNTSPNNLTKDNLLQRITIAGKNSFETMFFNEFFSSQYVFFQLKHGFRRVKFFKKVKPELVLVTRIAWGNLEHREKHLGIEFKTLDQGFFESGIELNKLYKGFGLSGFYRYGPNQLNRLEDNLAIKLNFILDLGL